MFQHDVDVVFVFVFSCCFWRMVPLLLLLLLCAHCLLAGCCCCCWLFAPRLTLWLIIHIHAVELFADICCRCFGCRRGPRHGGVRSRFFLNILLMSMLMLEVNVILACSICSNVYIYTVRFSVCFFYVFFYFIFNSLLCREKERGEWKVKRTDYLQVS